MNKREMSERDICTKFITPAIQAAGWDLLTQIREEYTVSAGRIEVRGKLASRDKKTIRRADYILCYQSNQPIAVIEAKKNTCRMGEGMQQALDYAEKLDIPFAISSNGDGFLLHDRSGLLFKDPETLLSLDQLPSPDTLWPIYCQWKAVSPTQRYVIQQPYYDDGSGYAPRHYQMVAINRTVEAIAKGQNRILLVMATGTGKTYTAFQIIWRLWKSKQKKRILFLADRNALIDQTMRGDFKPFGAAMTKISNRKIEKASEIYLSLYQAVTGTEEAQNIYKQFSPTFFDLIVIDECHRGSADADSAWRAILDYFSAATHIGLTATPKETKEISNIDYFGEPIYTYSLKQGIDDGYLAPYKVIRINFDKDLTGWRPDAGQTDKHGQLIENREYNQRDFDKTLILTERTQLVAQTITDHLTKTNPMQKTIVFCENIDHAERMRQALVNLNPEQVRKNRKYIMRITGDEQEGKAELYNFCRAKEPYPVIAVTSKLMTTGVDAKTCKLIVLDQRIQSMTEFKQIIGRGTRLDEAHNKLWFTILDFKKATELFSDPDFDGDPVSIIEPENGDDDEGEDGDTGDDTGGKAPEPRKVFVVDNVSVQIDGQQIQYLDGQGQLITEQLIDYTLKTVTAEFATLTAFLKRWNEAERKQVIIDELAKRGVFWEDLTADLKQKLGDESDPFDVIAHLVYGQPALTRKQRAAKARRADYFSQYQGTARAVLDALLDKYADSGVQSIEQSSILRLPPFDQMGTPMELVKAFGNKAGYEQALRGLENLLYTDSAS